VRKGRVANQSAKAAAGMPIELGRQYEYPEMAHLKPVARHNEANKTLVATGDNVHHLPGPIHGAAFPVLMGCALDVSVTLGAAIGFAFIPLSSPDRFEGCQEQKPNQRMHRTRR
jgi:hypothetical protein